MARLILEHASIPCLGFRQLPVCMANNGSPHRFVHRKLKIFRSSLYGLFLLHQRCHICRYASSTLRAKPASSRSALRSISPRNAARRAAKFSRSLASSTPFAT